MPRRIKLTRQRGGGNETCPPGFLCMNNTFGLVLVFFAIAVAGIFVYLALQRKEAAPQPIKIKIEMPEAKQPRYKQTQVPTPPFSDPVVPSLQSIPTQGMGSGYQQVGILVAPGGSQIASTGQRTLIPLFGSSINSRRGKWNYYTRTDGLNPVQVPIRHKNRDCDEDIGCDELYDGDEISVPALGQTYAVNIYKQKGFAYNPGVF